mmetsp:Transcript_30750/g.70909  ORF Transcript_30750/g.70909 Transcript_30750/m.70909 type:complete len:440 (+) Transcript_30750:95-1414(+)|eukprot:CAMPEP_0114560720 /NCGR_PEP_ID=MMETSP0114-20121206/11609_1 /TAXON_ID=31324 /ORGANISM="Goniomonas sp, Strain m" /LENGTH=439 /DNA_ID=CAMNT_0001746283 /DNA_START=92 /DNA_END=1411 /DNA_ORIENTATION=+
MHAASLKQQFEDVVDISSIFDDDGLNHQLMRQLQLDLQPGESLDRSEQEREIFSHCRDISTPCTSPRTPDWMEDSRPDATSAAATPIFSYVWTPEPVPDRVARRPLGHSSRDAERASPTSNKTRKMIGENLEPESPLADHQSEGPLKIPPLIIATVTAQFSVGQRVDLETLVLTDVEAKSSFKNQRSIPIDLGNGRKISACVFSNGTIKLAGCKTDREVEDAALRVVNILRFAKPPVVVNSAKLHRDQLKIVLRKGDVDVGFPLALPKVYDLLQRHFPQSVDYEPTRYCGLKVRVPCPNLDKPPCILLFRSGKAQAAGRASEEDLSVAWAKIATLLLEHKSLVSGDSRALGPRTTASTPTTSAAPTRPLKKTKKPKPAPKPRGRGKRPASTTSSTTASTPRPSKARRLAASSSDVPGPAILPLAHSVGGTELRKAANAA